MKKIYEFPVKDLMKEYAENHLTRGQVFKTKDVKRWFRENYPKVADQTVQLHVDAMAVNNAERRSRRPLFQEGKGFDLFYKVGKGAYRLWEPETDPEPLYWGVNLTPKKKSPNWTRDETILALDLYFQEGRKFLDDLHPKVIELSEELNKISEITEREPTFRNANGIAMKIANLASLDPLHTSAGKKGLRQGAKLDKIIWDEFFSDPANLHKVAEAIRSCAPSNDADFLNYEDDQWDEESAPEGKILTRTHRARERDRKIVKKKKLKVQNEKGKLECEACKFVFGVTYGDRGKTFIECHHTKPLIEYKGEEKTRLEDLSLLCANCHRMIHAKCPWLTIDELKKILNEARAV